MATVPVAGSTRARSPNGSLSPPATKKPRLETNRIEIDMDIDVDASAELDPPVPSVPDPSTTATAATPVAKSAKKQPKKAKGGKKRKPVDPEQGTSEDVNLHDVYSLLGRDTVDAAVKAGKEYDSPLKEEGMVEMELVVSTLSSHGESISLLPSPHPPWAVLVPFALPGERIRVRIHRHAKLHSYGDLLEVIEPNNEMRDNSLIKCKYFGTCSGCQYQMLPYSTQLTLKQRVVEKAYETYSHLPPSLVPSVLPTIPSPQQYAYRTKITPHFDAMPKSVQRARNGESKDEDDAKDAAKKAWDLRIGFDMKGRRSVMDIEECPIATPVLNEGLTTARAEVQKTIHTFKRGATLLLRDSIDTSSDATSPEDDKHVCITSHKATIRERVGSTLFEFPAGSFFQNNNSILEPLTSYVRDAIFNPPASSSDSEASPRKNPTHLVDTYCGSGLFSIMLSPHFSHVAGIEIDPQSIKYAKHNLQLNSLPESKHAFHAGKSEDIFASVLRDSKTRFPPEETAVVIDPPRKGCDESFVKQVVEFNPAWIVYVSCNVHTQARDVGMMLRAMEEKEKGTEGGGRRYVLESVRGFDLFPQTAHVESVAVLRLV